MPFFGVPYLIQFVILPFWAREYSGKTITSEHFASHFFPRTFMLVIFHQWFKFLILPFLMKAWVQEWFNDIRKCHNEWRASGSKSHICSWGWSGGGIYWPVNSCFLLLLGSMAFPKLSLTNTKGHQSYIPQTGKDFGDRRITDLPPLFSAGMPDAYSL